MASHVEILDEKQDQAWSSDSSIKFCAINVNSLGTIKKRLDLEDFVNAYKIDVALISETKLNSKH